MTRKITIASAKDKARRLQQWVAKEISKITGIKSGKDCDIESREMGQSGVDIKLYGKAKELFPFSIECKYQETWKIPEWIKQAKENQQPDMPWLLFVKKNHHEEIVILDAKIFFKLMEKIINE